MARHGRPRVGADPGRRDATRVVAADRPGRSAGPALVGGPDRRTPCATAPEATRPSAPTRSPPRPTGSEANVAAGAPRSPSDRCSRTRWPSSSPDIVRCPSTPSWSRSSRRRRSGWRLRAARPPGTTSSPSIRRPGPRSEFLAFRASSLDEGDDAVSDPDTGSTRSGPTTSSPTILDALRTAAGFRDVAHWTWTSGPIDLRDAHPRRRPRRAAFDPGRTYLAPRPSTGSSPRSKKAPAPSRAAARRLAQDVVVTGDPAVAAPLLDRLRRLAGG